MSGRQQSHGLSGLLRLARQQRRLLVLATGLAALATILSLTPAILVAMVIDRLEASTAEQPLLPLVAVAAILLAARWISMVGALMASHTASYRILYELRLAIADKLTRVPLGTITRRRSGSIRKILQEDVERIELFVSHMIVDGVCATVLPISAFLVLLTVDPCVAAASVSMLPLAWLVQRRLYRDVDKDMRTYGEASEAMNGALIETIDAIPVLKIFPGSIRNGADMAGSINAYRRQLEIIARRTLPAWSTFRLIMCSGMLVVAAVAAWRFQGGSLSLAGLALSLIVGGELLQPLMRVMAASSLLRSIESGFHRIRDILDAPDLPRLEGEAHPRSNAIAFQDVCFGYGGKRVFENLSFSIDAGTMVALVGPSGAGKSTVARLLARFFDPDEGRILVGGADLRAIPPHDAAATLGFVLQDTVLFDDSALDNIRLARPEAPSHTVVKAAADAGIHDTILRLANGYGTIIGERGATLSGGERQRLAIARTFLQDPAIMILDEISSHADARTEDALVQALAKRKVGKTVLAITHRPALLSIADCVMFMANGRIVAQGTHDELMAANADYRQHFREPGDTPLAATAI